MPKLGEYIKSMKVLEKISLVLLTLVVAGGLFLVPHASAMSPGMDMDPCPQQIHCQACNTLPSEDSLPGKNYPPAQDYIPAVHSLHTLVPTEPLERPPQ